MRLESLDELLQFRRCCDLQGNPMSVTVGRRNGKATVFLAPQDRETAQAPELQEFWNKERFFINLTPLERQTWRKILSAQSISSIAREEGVSRQAVYARILGNAKGQGGMIAKNVWVLLWWRLRQRFLTDNPYV
jgi:hypothetical protein